MSQESLRLRLYKHPKSGIWQIRGTYLGAHVDESAGTRVERDAEGVLERRKREIYEEVVLAKPRDRSFAEAAIGYMKSGGEKPPLKAILAAKLRVDGKQRIFGELLLREIDQSVIDDLAVHLKPRCKPSTRTRHVYTPISAVLTWASEQRSWGFAHGRIRRPKQPPGRLDWRTPKEIEWWLSQAGPEKAILIGYVGTGARGSELINLDWPDVASGAKRFTLWEKDTKARKARSLDLQQRVLEALPTPPSDGKGPVYRNSKGGRWTLIAVEKALDRITVRAARAAATDLEAEEVAEYVWKAASAKFDADTRSRARKRAQALYEAIAERENIPWIHPHVLRHTWATWAYAVTSDLPWLMQQGGWAKPDIAMRYMHVGTPELGDDVRRHGWEMRPRISRRLIEKAS
jgi:integrase